MTDDLEITEEERRIFTSWKLDVLDAMSCDPDVREIDFRVAFRLMQHVNKNTREAHPSIDRIAAQIGRSRYTVMRSIDWLTGKPDAKGRRGPIWIDRKRNSRRAPYFYAFREDRVSAVLDGKILREEDAKDAVLERRENSADVATVQHRKSPDVADVLLADVANLLTPDVAGLPPKHLSQNYLNRTPTEKGSEERTFNAYAREKGKVA